MSSPVTPSNYLSIDEEGGIVNKNENPKNSEDPLATSVGTATATADANNERFCRICLESDDPQDLIAPCRCKGSSKWVHRQCLDQWRTVNRDDLAFSRCSECHFEYHLVTSPSHTKQRKQCRYCLFVSRDVCTIFWGLQLLIGAGGVLVWLAVFRSGLYHEVVINNNNIDDDNSGGSSIDSFECGATCQLVWSYLGGLCIWLLTLGIYGLTILCAHSCNVTHSVNAISDHAFPDAAPATSRAIPVTSQGVADRGWNNNRDDDDDQTNNWYPQSQQEYRAFNDRYHPRRRQRRYRGGNCCCWYGPSYYEPYPYYYSYYPNDCCCCYCPQTNHSSSSSSSDCCCCCCGDHCHHVSSSLGGSGGNSSSNDDSTHILLVILAIVGIILCTIGLIVGAVLVCIAIQRILLRHVWILQKQRLVEEFQVQDLSASASEESSTVDAACYPEPIPAPTVDLPPPVPIPQNDQERLKKLGLVA